MPNQGPQSRGRRPIIASYCVVSAILGHIFLKEKLKPAQYACILAIIAGIIVIGFTGD